VKKIYQDIETNKGPARIYKGHSLQGCPVTYKRVDVIRHNLGNSYNSDLMVLYKNKSGILKYEIFRDGSFFPYYGTFEYTAKAGRKGTSRY